MAHIRTRELKGGGKAYLVRWQDASSKERSKQFAKMGDARAFKVEIERELIRGTYVDPRSGEITLRQFGQLWCDQRVDHRATTAARVRRDLAKHVYPMIGDLRIGAARRSDLQCWVHQLVSTSGLAPSTVGVIVATAHAVFERAVSDGLIARNPCKGLSLPEIKNSEVLIPTDEQFRAVLAGLHSPWYRRLVLVAAGTGMRSGELRGLTVDGDRPGDPPRVDFLRRMIRVDRQLVGIATDGQPIFGPPKSAAGYRTIPVDQTVMDVLARQIAESGIGPGGVIFTGRDKQLIAREYVTSALSRVFDRLGWPKQTGLHLFRHYYASMLIREGCNPKVVQKRLGDASAVITMDTYLHLWPDDDDRSRSAVAKVLGPIIAEASTGPSQVREAAISPSRTDRKVTSIVCQAASNA
jgi:integrase